MKTVLIVLVFAGACLISYEGGVYRGKSSYRIRPGHPKAYGGIADGQIIYGVPENTATPGATFHPLYTGPLGDLPSGIYIRCDGDRPGVFRTPTSNGASLCGLDDFLFGKQPKPRELSGGLRARMMGLYEEVDKELDSTQP